MASINHEKGLCYFHAPKTAGSYIQGLLHRNYGFLNYNQLVRYDLDEIKITPEFFKIGNGKKRINNQVYGATNPYSSKKIGIQKYYSCSPLLLQMMNLSEEKWDRLIKFTFVRDPYSRFISSWNYVMNGFKTKLIFNDEKYNEEDYESFKDLQYMIDNRDILTPIAYNHIFVTQYEHILDRNDENNLDFIGKTENLETDLEVILNHVGITEITHKPSTEVNKTERQILQGILYTGNFGICE